MPDDPAFIRMIAATPDDDAPRLVYADYLDETGDPAKMARAEFIRVQVEKARLVPDTPRWTELWHRDTALLDWARQWRAELPEIDGVQYRGFIRGFIEQVTAAGAPLARHFRLIVDNIPVRKVVLTDANVRSFRQIAAAPELSEVEEIQFLTNSWLSAGMIQSLATRGPWPKLRRLRLMALGGVLHPPEGTRGTDWDHLLAVFGDRLTA